MFGAIRRWQRRKAFRLLLRQARRHRVAVQQARKFTAVDRAKAEKVAFESGARRMQAVLAHRFDGWGQSGPRSAVMMVQAGLLARNPNGIPT